MAASTHKPRAARVGEGTQGVQVGRGEGAKVSQTGRTWKPYVYNEERGERMAMTGALGSRRFGFDNECSVALTLVMGGYRVQRLWLGVSAKTILSPLELWFCAVSSAGE